MHRNPEPPEENDSGRDYSRNIAVHMTEEQYQCLQRYMEMTRFHVTLYFRKLSHP